MAGIEDQVAEWRGGVMDKPRRGITRSEYIQQFLRLVERRIHPAVLSLTEWQVRHAVYHGPGRYEWADPEWTTLRLGDTWGGEGLTGFFRYRLVVPEAWAGWPLTLDLFFGGDGVLSVNGKKWAGMECFHREILLAESAVAGMVYELEAEISVDHQVTPGPCHQLHYARAQTIDREIESFYWDFRAAFVSADNEWADPETAAFILKHLEAAMLLCDPYCPDEAAFREGVRQAVAHLRGQVYGSGDYAPRGQLTILGHSHLDPVYMWDYKEFQRKILRTHTTQAMLMEEFPDWKFSQSQALIYQEIRDLYPDLFARIKELVAAGRWELLGGMFVEPDCNLSSGESMVRQFLVGQRFFRQEFGVTCRVGWVPDVFGMPRTFPQIMRGCGIDYFFTCKFVWNDTNEWRTNLFWWVGPDGSRILAHTPPLHFIGTCEGAHIQKYWALLGPKEFVREGLYTYGWGDGGGGVERRMLLVAQRTAALPGAPVLKHRSAEAFFDDLAATLSEDLPQWHNEMYLETHRGTYTSAALLKKRNRQAEERIKVAEIIASAARLQGAPDDKAALDACWNTILVNQFHDILPGSHIEKGFTDAVAAYQECLAALDGLTARGAEALARNIARPAGRRAAVVFNALLWPRQAELLLAPDAGPGVADADGNPLPTQVVDHFGEPRLLASVPLPACGYAVLSLLDDAPAPAPAAAAPAVAVTPRTLENRHLRLTLDDQGEMLSLFDKQAGREVLVPGTRGCRYQMFEDDPGKYNAWDIAKVYEKRAWHLAEAVSIAVVDRGPLRASIRVERRFSQSRLTHTYILDADAAWVDCDIWVDWHEENKLLKLAVDVDVLADRATYHIPYGFIERPTHRDTSWDQAKFEVSAHTFADLSEAGYGFALINDCKYGYDVCGKTMRLTLLKASTFPNPKADRHEHTLGIRLYPHRGDWRQGRVWETALGFNAPPACHLLGEASPAAPASLPPQASFLAWEGESTIQLEAWKRAEDDDGHILRFREALGASARGTLRLPFVATKAFICNHIEDKERPLAVDGDRVELAFSPCQVVTLWLDDGAAK
jgi:alpha-mannosidase